MMNTKKMRISAGAVIALVALAMVGGTAASQAIGRLGGQEGEETAAVAKATPTPTAIPGEQVTADAPASSEEGAYVDAVMEIARSLVPADAELVEVNEYPELKAAMAAFVSGDDAYTVSIQRPSAPASVEEMALTGKASVQELSTGSTQVDILGADYEQSVIVRDSGLTITVARTGLTQTSARIAPQAEKTIQSLSEALVSVDGDAVEGLVP